MKISTKFTFIVMGAMLMLTALWIPASVEAQIVLRNQTRLSRSSVDQIVKRLENSSDRFRRQFEQQMDRNRRRDDERYVQIVDRFEVAVDELRREFDASNSWWTSRNQVSEVVREGQNVNQMMNSISFRRNLETQWNAMRNDINILADTYDLPGLNGGGWQGGGWQGGGWQGGGWRGGTPMRPPSWAVGTFYATSGNDQITLTITSDGYATVLNGGQTYSGAYTRNGLWVNGDTSTLQRTRNGIRTYNRNERVWTNYSRDGFQTPGTGSRPPNWAIGTFVNNNSDTTVSIDASGRVTVYTGGQTYYGTYNGSANTLFLNGDTSTVTQSGRGIRTYNSRTGETTNYRRQ